MRSIKNSSLILLIFMMIFSFTINSVYAKEAKSSQDTGSISIVKLLNKENGKSVIPVSGSVFGLIKIGDEEIGNKEKEVLAKQLESMSLEQIQKEYESKGKMIISNATDSKGETVVSNLSVGSYYIVEITKIGNLWKKSNQTSPLVVNSEKTSKLVKVYTKSTVPSKGKELLVKKVWVGNKLKRIQVYLYANEQKVDEAELSESNGWMYTFKALKEKEINGKDIIYSVKEEVPSGYISEIKENSTNEFVITNTEKSNRSSSDAGGKIGSIIKTGDWKVYLIIGVGIVLMALGYKVYRKKTDKK
ncbi:Cna B-type domain-containing protein [Peptostreptococcus sp. D1]|uniref:Cna B-type domain-containing protein n=1 Tax=Peptostreptococcus sp. D1 TaxID=72304 RepID=UPI0008F02192|nr:Cna B-type domain-containing protein [Peptostreptococcus sp. D1]SFE55840.1 hypothetical protein SAMN02910278_01137 [Peptostreptococcus sp. D1]